MLPSVREHLDLPRVEAPLAELRQTDFVPFRRLADMRWGMTCHVIYTAIDPERPATQSSKVIAETYRMVSVTLKSGAILDGRIVAEEAGTLSIAINPTDPDQRRRVNTADIQTQRVSDVSPMPPGLVNTLTKEEILDLIAFLETGIMSAPPLRAGGPPR